MSEGGSPGCLQPGSRSDTRFLSCPEGVSFPLALWLDFRRPFMLNSWRADAFATRHCTPTSSHSRVIVAVACSITIIPGGLSSEC